MRDWQAVQSLFDQALNTPLGDRDNFLRRACAGDTRLLAEVRSLLESDAGEDQALDLIEVEVAALRGNTQPEQIGPYRVERTVGAGGMGVVYEATDSRLGRSVAVKVLSPAISASPQGRERFEVEARAASSLEHPNICVIHELGETQSGELYFTMPLYRGSTLHDKLMGEPLSFATACDIGRQVALGLAHAHGKGVLHRDIKPANIFITDDLVVKILDFGIAKIHGVDLTAPGDRLGTLVYSAPEQLNGDSVDERADIWALGAVLYRVLAGVLPFDGDSAAALINAILNKPVKPLRKAAPACPRPLADIVHSALQVEPALRVQSARTFAAALEALNTSTSSRPVQGGGMRTSEQQSARGERRLVTVLHASVLVDDDDHEEMAEDIIAQLPTLRTAFTELAHEADAFIAQSAQDEFVAFFGYPIAYGNDAERATRFALSLLGVVKAAAESTRSRLVMRIGIHTDTVTMNNLQEAHPTVVGHAPKVAQWLHTLAMPNQIILSAATYRIAKRRVRCRSTGVHSFGPANLNTETYRLLSSRRSANAGAGWPTRGPEDARAAMVGRDHELALLRDHWERACDAQGSGVLLLGEPGIGKSRLLLAFQSLIQLQAQVIEWRCSPYFAGSALHPMVDWMIRVAPRLHPAKAPAVRLKALEALLSQAQTPLRDTVPLFASLLGIELNDSYAPRQDDPGHRREELLRTIVSIVLSVAEERPVALVIEDVHWADETTFELIQLIVGQAFGTRILLLASARANETTPFTTIPGIMQMMLTRLKKRDLVALAENIAGAKRLPEPILREIAQKTDGVPLFIEEITRAVLEADIFSESTTHFELKTQLDELALPATLTESLSARLENLGSAKAVAQIAATAGRTVPLKVLERVCGMPSEALTSALTRLVDAGLMLRRGIGCEAHLSFRHALIQETAYGTLLKSAQREHHLAIATVLAASPELCADAPEVLAHHFGKARHYVQAAHHWRLAGRQAAQRSALREAAAYLQRGLKVLERADPGPDRMQEELALQTRLGPTLLAVKGYAAPEVKQAFSRAEALCLETGTSEELFLVRRGLWAYHFVRAEIDTSRVLAEQLLTMALDGNESSSQIEAHRARGMTALHHGEFRVAANHLEQGVVLYDTAIHRGHAVDYGNDPGIVCLSLGARALWLLGKAKQALAQQHAALELAETLKHPFSKGHALIASAMLHQHMHDSATTLALSDEALIITGEQGFPYWAALARILRGWAVAKQGSTEGTDEIQEALSDYANTGAHLAYPWFLALYAQTLADTGETDGALDAIVRARAMCDASDEGYYAAELCRLHAELTLAADAKDARPQAEGLLRRSLHIAEDQGAQAWRLRSAVSLACHWPAHPQALATFASLKVMLPGTNDVIAMEDKSLDGAFSTWDMQRARALVV